MATYRNVLTQAPTLSAMAFCSVDSMVRTVSMCFSSRLMSGIGNFWYTCCLSATTTILCRICWNFLSNNITNNSESLLILDCTLLCNKKLLKRVWPDGKANSKTQRLTKVNQNLDRWTDGHHQSISQNCFAIQLKVKISKSYICTQPHLQRHMKSVKCEQPLYELTVKI